MKCNQPKNILFWPLALAITVFGCSRESSQVRADKDVNVVPGRVATMDEPHSGASFYTVADYDEGETRLPT